jgi:hypothetical protein
MEIKRKSPFENKYNTLNIDVTQEQLDAWKNGCLIQDAMPNLTPDEREFIKSGITPAEWEKLFS